MFQHKHKFEHKVKLGNLTSFQNWAHNILENLGNT
jgi:hypothetical protein